MKRIACFILTALLLTISLSWSIGNIVVFASDVEIAVDAPSLFSEDTADFSCRLDVETSKIHLGGQIRHDVFVTHSDYRIEIYAIPPGQSAEAVLRDPNVAPIAGAAIAIKFEFALETRDILDKYSRYCVVLRSPDGTHMLASEPKFAEVGASLTVDPHDRSAYKGVATEQIATASHAGAGRVILPVYFDRLLSSTSSGYVYQSGTENLYFEKSYMEALDVNIRAATVAGAEVYLQYFPASDEVSAMPNVYDTDVLKTIESVTVFLCERYAEATGAHMSGIVVGKTMDLFMPTDTEDIEALTQYAEKYALYVIAVANTARRIQSDMDIVLAFSSVNSYGNAGADVRTPSALLERVLSIFDRGFSDRFSCTTMIESDTVPLIYPEGWDTYNAPLQPIGNDAVLHAGNAEIYAQYLESLHARFSSVPNAFMFVWQVPDSLSRNALSAAYAYSYFRLISQTGLSSFVVSFTEQERQGNTRGFDSLSHLYTYVDTYESSSVTKNILRYFAMNAWSELSVTPYDGSYAMRALYHTTPSRTLPSNVKGSFSYFDFSTSVNLNSWFFGNACRGIRLNYHESGGKALQMEMSASVHGYAEAFCLYEYPENLVYTPYVAFRVGIDAQEKSSAARLYEIMITSGTGRTCIVAKTSLPAGEMATLTLDLSSYSSANMSDYWRISVRPLDGESGDYSLWIYDIVGYSTEWSSEELREQIEAERLRIRNLDHPDDGTGGGYERLWIVVGIVGVALMIGIGIFILLRPHDDGGREEGSPNDRE